MSNKTAEYRITLSRLIVSPATVAPLPSISYPDRHRRTDKQIAVSTLHYMAATFIGLAVVIGIALVMGVR
jgi:hypothetical protein